MNSGRLSSGCFAVLLRCRPRMPRVRWQSRFVSLRSLACLAGLLGVACSTPSHTIECDFEEGEEVTQDRFQFDSIRLLSNGSTLWSSEGGLFFRGAEGTDSVRIGAPCTGGFDAFLDTSPIPEADAEPGPFVTVVCARRAYLGHLGDLSLIRFSVEARETRRTQLLALLGRDPAEPTLTRHLNELVVLWRDGFAGAWAIRALRFTPFVELPEPLTLSNPELIPGTPNLYSDANRVVGVWTEAWIDAGYPRGHIVTSTNLALPLRSIEVDILDATPTFFSDDQGDMIVFRDFRRPHRNESYYVQRVGARSRATGRARRLTRGDVAESADVFECAGSLVIAHPRSWSGDILATIHILDERWRRRIPEQQVYEWAARFTVSSSACIDERIITFIGERGDAAHPEIRAHLQPLRCFEDAE